MTGVRLPAPGSRAALRRGVRFLTGALTRPVGPFRNAALRTLARLHGPRRVAHPFFQSLHDLLEVDGDLSLGELLDSAGEQTYGLAILLLSLASFIPGVSIAGGIAVMVLGAQMAAGVPHPWLPRRALAVQLHRGKIKDALARFEGWLVRLGGGPRPRRPLSRRAVGAVVAWAGLLLALPVPVMVVGGNALPAAALCLLGAALLEERPSWAWLGVLGTLLTTAYLALSFDLIARTLMHLLRKG